MNKLFNIDIQLFADNVNVTTDGGLSAEMKTFYEATLIDQAGPNLVHAQFGQKRPIPKNKGKIIEFRKYSALPKSVTPLTEGVTPNGQKLTMSTISTTVNQYGGYVALSDMVDMTAIDNNLVEATVLLGDQSGVTLDTITREVLNGGTNVQYADARVSARNLLVGGAATGNDYMTVDCVNRAVRALKKQNGKKIGDSYIAIIHPDVSYDLKKDPAWLAVKEYDPKDLYEGEIGKLGGVRFVESTEAKIFGKVGASGRSVYSTLFLARDAYGITEIEGGGLQHIVKQLGSGGTADPLNQRATAGWKATAATIRLVEPYMVRVETTSTFNEEAN